MDSLISAGGESAIPLEADQAEKKKSCLQLIWLILAWPY